METKIELPYDPAKTVLGIYPKDSAPQYDKATCIPMFTLALFTMATLGNSSEAQQLMNGSRKCDLYAQWSIIQP
jgi:hypothetical protein